MYKVTYQVASEMQKRIWRPCGFSVGVGEGFQHENGNGARRGCVSRHAGKTESSPRHSKDYKNVKSFLTAHHRPDCVE